MLITSNHVKGILKIRGIFRLIRIFILIRKLNTIRVKREVSKKKIHSTGYQLSSPLEKVLDILGNLRDKIDSGEGKIIQDLNYCIKMIQSNQLYEAKIDIEEGDSSKGGDMQNLKMLLNQYSTSAQQQKEKETRLISSS